VLSIEGLALLLFVSAAGVAGMLLAIPRAIDPVETRGLHLAPDDVRASFDRDEAGLASLPPESESAEAKRLYAELNAIEAGPPGTAREHAAALHAEIERVRSSAGDDAVDALRREAATRVASDLARASDDPDRARTVGSFEGFLDLYSARLDSRVVAPPIVVRTMFKARWNLVHALEPTEGLGAFELAVYWGWLAFEAVGVEPPRRLAALDHYEQATGEDVREARATLLFLAGRAADASSVLRELREGGENLRLRNHALAALAESSE
jgi:hypothetical protein